MSMVKYDILHGSNCISNYSCKIRYVHNKEYNLIVKLHYYDYLKLSRYQYENIQKIWDSKNTHPEIASWHYMQEKHLT